MDLSSKSADLMWVEAALGVKHFRNTSWPFLEECRKLVADYRANLWARSGRRPQLGLEGTIRGRSVWVRNTPKMVELLIPPEDVPATVDWLLGCFEDDKDEAAPVARKPRTFPHLRMLSADAGPSASAAAAAPEPPAEQASAGDSAEERVRERILMELRSAPEVQRPTWMASRGAFRAKGTSGDERHFEGTVCGLKKLRARTDPAEATFEPAYREAAASLLQKARAAGTSGAAPGSEDSEGASAGAAAGL